MAQPAPPPPPPGMEAIPGWRPATGKDGRPIASYIGNKNAAPGGHPTLYLHNPLTQPAVKDCDELWSLFVAYVEWAEANPIQEEQVFSASAGIRRTTVAKVRALTWQGFARHSGLNYTTMQHWRTGYNRKDLAPAVQGIEDVIFSHQFEHAAAGLLRDNIVSRYLGLAEKQQVQAQVMQEKAESGQLANRTHPDCSLEEIEAIYAAGLEPPLYSQNQIDAGMPYTSPLTRTINHE